MLRVFSDIDIWIGLRWEEERRGRTKERWGGVAVSIPADIYALARSMHWLDLCIGSIYALARSMHWLDLCPDSDLTLGLSCLALPRLIFLILMAHLMRWRLSGAGKFLPLNCEAAVGVGNTAIPLIPLIGLLQSNSTPRFNIPSPYIESLPSPS
jgi:hypothetical protein